MKKANTIFLYPHPHPLFYEIQLRAQNAPSIEWQKCFGGSSNDYARSIQQTIDGGLIIAGYSYSNDGDVSGNHGGADYWIVKTDEVGNTIWQKCFGGTGNDYAYSIQQTTDGGFIATGVSKSNDGDVSGNHGWSDIWTLKLDSSGNITWSTCSGGSYNEAAYSVRETINGDYIIAGHTNSIDGDVVVGDDNWYTNQYWIILLDSSGNLKDQGGGGDYTAHELAYDIQPIGDGGYVFVGQENTGGNYEDYFSINWIDSSLAYAWSGVGFLGEPAGAYAVALTSNNGFVIAGYADTYYYGDANYAILNLDSNQNINWFAELGGSGSDIAWSVQQTSDKGYIAAGYTGSNNGDVSGNHGGNDYWIVYLDSAGNLAWQKALGGSNNDEAFSVQQTVDNGFIIAGNANSYDGNVSGSHGGSDYWIVKLSCYMSQAFMPTVIMMASAMLLQV
ncbi:MAG: hypothetical protein IPG01_18905 [Chitinophagaceae bacterium]|nr:hypothetical protein [Chitinophagaceae bacterium]